MYSQVRHIAHEVKYVFSISETSQRHLDMSITAAEAEALFAIIAASQARRIDDQRFALPMLPGICGMFEQQEYDRDRRVRVSYTKYKGWNLNVTLKYY